MIGKSLTLNRPARQGAVISLVPMIDVMLILLVFFMVTSTYLNLDMIPAVRQSDDVQSSSPGQTTSPIMMVRLGEDGLPAIKGQALDQAQLIAAIKARIADDPLTQVIVLPSGGATTQALVSVMDASAQAGATRLRVIRLEARQ